MSVSLSALRVAVAEELACHVEAFACEDGVTGVGVPQIVQSERFW